VSDLFYRLFVWLRRHVGDGPLRAFTWVVATFYFLCFPARRANSREFFRALSPEKSGGEIRRQVWRQFQEFARTYVDRLRVLDQVEDEFVDVGNDELHAAFAAEQGLVIVASHLGNWEIAAAHMMRWHERKFMAYIGEREQERVEQLQKDSLSGAGVQLVTISAATASPFDLLPATRFLREGGIVSIAGDRVWSPAQRCLEVEFLGGRAQTPTAPFVLGALCDVPVFAVFCVRAGGRFQLLSQRLHDPGKGVARQARLQAMAEQYLGALIAVARRHPSQWFHFERFLQH
jgi:predicted LPLAT superfamily acyltransferase